MKKFLKSVAVIVALGLAFSFLSCDNGSDSSSDFVGNTYLQTVYERIRVRDSSTRITSVTKISDTKLRFYERETNTAYTDDNYTCDVTITKNGSDYIFDWSECSPDSRRSSFEGNVSTYGWEDYARRIDGSIRFSDSTSIVYDDLQGTYEVDEGRRVIRITISGQSAELSYSDDKQTLVMDWSEIEEGQSDTYRRTYVRQSGTSKNFSFSKFPVIIRLIIETGSDAFPISDGFKKHGILDVCISAEESGSRVKFPYRMVANIKNPFQ